MITVEKVLRLRQVPLFAELGVSELGHVADIAEEVGFAARASIFREGDDGDGLFLLLEGRVRIATAERELSVLEPGACFGEMSLLDGEPRAAAAEAVEDCRLLWIAKDDFEEILAAHAPVSLAVLRVLSRRVREMTASSEVASAPSPGRSRERKLGLGGLAAALLLGPLALLAPAPSTAQDAGSFSVTNPQRSAASVKRLRDALATRALVHLGYREGAGCAGIPGRLAALDGLDGARTLCRVSTDGTLRVLELAWSAHPAGGHELHVVGRETAAGATARNPDLDELEPLALELAAGAAAPALHELDVSVLQLGHVQADRAIGLLKAVGYSTVEFRATEGESVYDRVYEPVAEGELRLPVIVKVIDAPKTSLMDPAPASDPMAGGMPAAPMMDGQSQAGVADLGGSFLHQATADDPLQRLLVVHDAADPEPLARLQRFLAETVDVAARQVSVEALVLEVDSDRLRDIGVEFSWMDSEVGATYEAGEDLTQTPFTFLFDKYGGLNGGLASFTAKLTALVKTGNAEILSNPSVLVLDGRQARIQIGQRVPIVTSTATANTVSQRVDYETVGIVLNIRPRIDERTNQVSMQVQTIVSAVAASVVPTVGDTIFAPTFENRHVQSFVRVPDATPFIVGGLISDARREEVRRVPGLSRIPLLGNLFKRKIKDRAKREVIIVVTPHVVPLDDKNFSHVIPKESDQFDTFDNQLFRDTYRIREREVFDLSFVSESPTLERLRSLAEMRSAARPALREDEGVAALLDGRVPGEEVLVRRMLWETVRHTESWKHVQPDRLIYFVAADGRGDVRLSFLAEALSGDEPPSRSRTGGRGRHAPSRPERALVLSFDARPAEAEGTVPTAQVEQRRLGSSDYRELLLEENARGRDGEAQQWAVVLTDSGSAPLSPLDFLRSAIVLRQVIALNGTLPLELDEFYSGRQLLYPSEEQLSKGFHVIDAEIARLFYEVQEYYLAFEQEFNAESASLRERLGEAEPARR